MKRKKISMYDTQETQILEKSTAFVQFLTRKGVLEDQNIDDEKEIISVIIPQMKLATQVRESWPLDTIP